MKNKNIHLMIIWCKALEYKKRIINDLQGAFKIKRIFNIKRTPELFMQNFTVFYAHSLKMLEHDELEKVLNEKIAHCGTNEFCAIIFEDENPEYLTRETSNGIRIVNANVFDKKSLYRQWAGGGHRIHATDDSWETNKDLTLLLGCNSDDFTNKYQGYSTIETNIERNCLGVNGYKSIEELFYVLNNTIKYVILRNFEPIPQKYNIEGHGDIDILVENRNYISYLTLSKPVFKEIYRVHNTININGENVPFDFRNIGDDYYDKKWEEHILENRKFNKKLFYIPSDEDLFYSLLYHAYIQKNDLKADYIPVLKQYGKGIDIIFLPEISQAIALLDIFMRKNNYEYIKPQDKSVAYNESNLSISTYALRHGKVIKTLYIKENNALYSKVFEKEDSFIKIGAKKLIDNEAFFLNRLAKYEYFPKIVRWNKCEDESLLEISRIIGEDFYSFFSNPKHRKLKYIRSFAKGCMDILKILLKEKIIHRDFTPFNLLINKVDDKCKVYLIDFGWAINYDNAYSEITNLKGLGNGYYNHNSYSDFQAVGNIFKKDFAQYKNFISISSLLESISFDDYNNTTDVNKKLEEIEKRLESISFNNFLYHLKDMYTSLLMSNSFIYKIRILINHIFKI